jgi:hypothetical protein
MAKRRITDYDLAWNPKRNQGRFLLRFEDGGQAKHAVNSADEFAAIAIVLKELREREIFEFDSGLVGTDPID